MKTALAVLLLLALLAWPARAHAQTRIAPPNGPVFSGTKSCGTGAAVIASATPVLSVVVRNASATIDVMLGGSTQQDFTLTPGLSLAFDVKDLSQVYCKTLSSSATLEFFAVKGP